MRASKKSGPLFYDERALCIEANGSTNIAFEVEFEVEVEVGVELVRQLIDRQAGGWGHTKF